LKKSLVLTTVFLVIGFTAMSQKTLLLHFNVEAGAFQRVKTLTNKIWNDFAYPPAVKILDK
jgi:hypothetical protein